MADDAEVGDGNDYSKIIANPAVPQEIGQAAQSGELVVFVGAGISKLISCPSWDEFADRVLDQLVPKGIDHYELSQIKGLKDPKKRLSFAKIIADKAKIKIDYGSVLTGRTKSGEKNVYTHLNTFDSAFVTTNYEKYLAPDSRMGKPEAEWRFYKRDQLLNDHLDRNGNVIHLHGCIDDASSLIITTRDYLDHYSSQEVTDFLHYLFERKTVLFLGYGLDEIEVLEYVFRRGGAKAADRVRRFILQGFFKEEHSLFKIMQAYYMESFTTQLIGFPKNQQSYQEQVSILANWASSLKFGGMAVADEFNLIQDEING